MGTKDIKHIGDYVGGKVLLVSHDSTASPKEAFNRPVTLKAVSTNVSRDVVTVTVECGPLNVPVEIPINQIKEFRDLMDLSDVRS